jgi:hypothetical protein
VVKASPAHQVATLLRRLTLIAGVAASGCTYNFSKFTVEQDANPGSGGALDGTDRVAPATGGTTTIVTTGGTTAPSPGGTTTPATSGGMAASKGGTTAPATGGSTAASAAPATGGNTTSRTGGSMTPDSGVCAGVAYGGICWYLGPTGSSCQQVCAKHGQPAPAAASYVGTTVQGGSISECRTLFGLLGMKGELESGTRSDGLGLGCHMVQTSALWWLSSPSFSVSAGAATIRLVCGCTQ